MPPALSLSGRRTWLRLSATLVVIVSLLVGTNAKLPRSELRFEKLLKYTPSSFDLPAEMKKSYRSAPPLAERISFDSAPVRNARPSVIGRNEMMSPGDFPTNPGQVALAVSARRLSVA